MASPPPVKRPPEIVAFFVGLFVGLFTGGVPLMLIVLFLFALLVNALKVPSGAQGLTVFLLSLVPAGGFAYGAYVWLRRGVDFVSGLFVGITAGLLGGIALCTAMLSQLNHTQ